MNEVTRILAAIEKGDQHAAEELLPLVYKELRQLAAKKLAHESPGQTLQSTALVHEAYIRLVGKEKGQRWDSRGHFFAAAAEAMRRILVENARRKNRLRHGGELRRIELRDAPASLNNEVEDLLALDEAMDRLAQVDPQAAQLVKLRYYAGLNMEQAAEVLGISLRSAERDWAFARAWLHRCVKS